MRRVAVVGAGTLPWRSRYSDRTMMGMAVEATRGALQDAGIGKRDVDAVVYSIFSETVLRQQIPTEPLQDAIGFEYGRSIRVEADAATELYALYAAFAEVASGMSDIVLLLGIQKGQDLYCSETRSRGDGFIRGSAQYLDTILTLPVCAGSPAFLTVAGWLPHMKKYGGPSPEQVARFSVMCHENALVNPDAQLKAAVTVEEVLESRIIAWPTTKLECCLYSDCAAALVLASEERARQICERPVWLAGISVSSFPSTRLEAQTMGRMIGVNTAAGKAYKMAGVTNPRAEIDVVEVGDLTSATGVLALEELGLCELGGGGRLVDEGAITRNSGLSVNPSGGRVACGHLAGVSGVYSVAHMVRQLQERAGPSQVPVKSGRGVVEVTDAFGGFAGVAVLER